MTSLKKDTLYANSDQAFSTGVLDDDGNYESISSYTGAEYCIFTKAGTEKLKLTLGSGIEKVANDFLIQISDTAINFSGVYYHQLVLIDADGNRLPPVFLNAVEVLLTCS